ncbi:hypothetical protein HYR69_08625 [Candidatus Sumerlaeota bacterium]|nr:hypothetical protein [Candidatus Sumerlaeota bacterium]MBI3734947.1 hypothetical protein [Candidatus Sumerlaeota bacterium]
MAVVVNVPSTRASIALHRISRAQERLAGTKTDEVIGAILQAIDTPIYEG